MSLPHVIGHTGASKPYLPPLAEDEATALRASAEVLAQTIAGGLEASEAQAWLLRLASGSR